MKGLNSGLASQQPGYNELLTGLKNIFIFFLPYTTGSGKSLKAVFLVAYIVVDNLRKTTLIDVLDAI